MGKAIDSRNFVIAGHTGSGKTLLCEQILLQSGAIARAGTIEGKNTVSDFTITIPPQSILSGNSSVVD